MSLLKTGAVQVGQSGAASNNFHWRNLLDGLLRLSRGNAGDASPTDVMRVNADNSVEFPGGVARGVLGAGQTWQNMSASRLANTNYTNTTGRPIMVFASLGSAAVQTTQILVDGVIAGQWICVGSAVYQGVMTVVPNGSVYRVVNYQGSASVGTWSELR